MKELYCEVCTRQQNMHIGHQRQQDKQRTIGDRKKQITLCEILICNTSTSIMLGFHFQYFKLIHIYFLL